MPRPLDAEAVRPLYGDDSSHDFDHVLRVVALAARLARAEGADPEVVRVAALLHDVAREHERRTGEDHAAAGAARARHLLAGHPAPFVDAVCHAVAAHRFRVEHPPRTAEARVLYDADKLDAMGAVGMARAFAYGGRSGRRLWAEDGAGEHTTLQEFRVKLSRLRDGMLTEAARPIARGRHAFMERFVEQMRAEVAGER